MAVQSQGTESESNLTDLNLIENHYVNLPSQGNIYSLVSLRRTKGNCKVMIASLNKKLFSIEFNNCKYEVFENQLACMPSKADLVSVNAYRSENNKFSIGLTFLIKDGSCKESLLYIFSECDLEGGLNFTDDLSSVSSIPLAFMPYTLFFTFLPSLQKTEVVWFVSGSDYRIHMFQISSLTNQYEEIPSLKDTFPELMRVEGITLDMDILYLDERKRRLTVTCGESGNVHVFNVNVFHPEGPVVMASRVIRFDFPCSSVKFFYCHKEISDVISLDFDRECEEKIEACDKPLLALATTLESCYVYRTDDMTSSGFLLPNSDNHDVVSCCIVCDINFDGKNEVVIGTYGQVILIYKQSTNGQSWVLLKKVKVASPVLALAYDDVLGDGVKELVVSTTHGVHIYQYDPEDVAKLIVERLRNLKM